MKLRTIKNIGPSLIQQFNLHRYFILIHRSHGIILEKIMSKHANVVVHGLICVFLHFFSAWPINRIYHYLSVSTLNLLTTTSTAMLCLTAPSKDSLSPQQSRLFLPTWLDMLPITLAGRALMLPSVSTWQFFLFSPQCLFTQLMQV